MQKEKKIIFDLFVPREKCYEMVSLLPKQEPKTKRETRPINNSDI